MKKLFTFLVFAVFFIQYSYGQDTLKHITSPCLNHIIKSETDSCPDGIHFRYLEDTLEIYGTIWANCCGTHLARITKTSDTINITTFDTGMLCNCNCRFCFNIKIPDATADTFVNFNQVVYNARKLFSIEPSLLKRKIEIFPNPADNSISFIVSQEISITEIQLQDITGRLIKVLKNDCSVIDISGLGKGIYFIHFNLEDGINVNKKFLKN